MESSVFMRNIQIYIFFFQAEDGIRDLTVTGVQTCALPISRWEHTTAARIGAVDPTSNILLVAGVLVAFVLLTGVVVAWSRVRVGTDQAAIVHSLGRERSEERRVGKEGRAGWWRCQGEARRA